MKQARLELRDLKGVRGMKAQSEPQERPVQTELPELPVRPGLRVRQELPAPPVQLALQTD